MDYTIFKEFASEEYDVLMVYQYSNLDLPEIIIDTLKNYKSSSLIAWSMGTWMANFLFQENSEICKHKIAINGTLKPVDDNNGILSKVYEATISHFGPIGRVKFFKRMWNNIEVPDIFRKHKSVRELEDQKAELIFLRDSAKNNIEPINMFDTVIIGEKDIITPTKNQIYYWDGKVEIKKIDSPHFPFYLWKNWDEIFEYL